MQWGAKLLTFFGGNRGAALQLLSGAGGIVVVIYGLQVLMVERTQIPVCSAELLSSVSEQSFLKTQVLTIEVAGAVVKPGVWQLPVGARVAEAIDKAGGFSSRADRTFAAQGLNLADPIKDGQKIYVPFTDEQKTIAADQENSVVSTENKISINQASQKDIDTLPGIGEARAVQIIENRPYTRIDELVTKGVLSQSIFDDIEALIAL